jgi:hypothetical protein
MPVPRAGEQRSAFIGRCMRYGDLQRLPQRERLGRCFGLWRQKHGRDTTRKSACAVSCACDSCNAQDTLATLYTYRSVDGATRQAMVCLDQTDDTDAVGEEDGSSVGILASNRRDLQGDVIRCKGVSFHIHRVNPMVLWDHGRMQTMPIGKCEAPDGSYTVQYWPDDEIITARTYWAPTDFAQQIYSLVRGGFLRSMSIAVKDRRVEAIPPDPDSGWPAKRGPNGNIVPYKHIIESDLIEATHTPLPVNPDAVASLLGKGYIDVGGYNAQRINDIIVKSFLPLLPASKVWANGYSPITLKSWRTEEAHWADGLTVRYNEDQPRGDERNAGHFGHSAHPRAAEREERKEEGKQPTKGEHAREKPPGKVRDKSRGEAPRTAYSQDAPLDIPRVLKPLSNLVQRAVKKVWARGYIRPKKRDEVLSELAERQEMKTEELKEKVTEAEKQLDEDYLGFKKDPVAMALYKGTQAILKERETSAKYIDLTTDRESRISSLATSPIRTSKPIGEDTANKPQLVTMDDGTVAVFKAQENEYKDMKHIPAAYLSGIQQGTFWKREVAASRLAEVMGFDDIVPPTAARESEGEVGSAQEYLYGARDAVRLSESQKYDGEKDAARAAVFDYVTGQLDRHGGNWMIRDGRIALTDNGISFPLKRDQMADRMAKASLLVHAHELPMPDLSHLKDKEDHVRKALSTSGLEPEAVNLAIGRFREATSGRYKTVGTLPAIHDSPDPSTEDEGTVQPKR